MLTFILYCLAMQIGIILYVRFLDRNAKFKLYYLCPVIGLIAFILEYLND